MELFLGFVVGVVASILASLIVSILPTHQYRPVIAFGRNPSLFFRLLHHGEERQIKGRIDALFDAWRKKDSKAYLACWAEDAIRIVGPKSNEEYKKGSIGAGFNAACLRYSKIDAPCVILEHIAFSPTRDNAVVHVYYRMNLLRAQDGLPVFEESSEVYALRKADGDWLITSNIDHFCEIRSTSTG